jgi:hypothetical protein
VFRYFICKINETDDHGFVSMATAMWFPWQQQCALDSGAEGREITSKTHLGFRVKFPFFVINQN